MKENSDIITKEFCKDKTLVFHPKSVAEAVFIQRQFLEMGFQWGNAHAHHKIQYVDECVSEGMAFEGGFLFWDPASATKKKALLCKASQFEKDFDKSDITNLLYTADHAATLATFSRLMAQLEKVNAELAATRDKVDAIYEVMAAANLVKKPAQRRSAG
jgi:hypothetical protein